MSAIYSEILFAETFGLEMAASLVEHAPEGALREFAQTQLADEAKHVDFFARIVNRLGASHPPSTHLKDLRDEVLSLTGYEDLALHSLILEAGARALFVENTRRTLQIIAAHPRLPGADSVSAVVQAMLENVGKDESRHIAFGHLCLKTRLRDAAKRELRSLETRATASATLMYKSFSARQLEFKTVGLAPTQVLSTVWAGMHSELRRLGLDLGEPLQ